MACRVAHKLRLVFPCREYEVDVSLLPEGSRSSMCLPGCGVGPLGAGSPFSSVWLLLLGTLPLNKVLLGIQQLL